MHLIESIQNARDDFASAKSEVARRHPRWPVAADARLAAFSKVINVLNSTQLGLVCLRFHLTDPRWWDGLAREPISRVDKEIYITEFDMFLKLGFLQFLFSSLESSLRLFLRALDPSACAGGTAEFRSIYSCLLARLGLEKHIPLLDLLRLIRNTVHNNGVYFHRSGTDEAVVYAGRTYAFHIGSPVSFVTWAFLFGLVPDVRRLLLGLVDSERITAIESIADPFAPRTDTGAV